MPARDDIDPLVGQIIDRRYRVISRIGDGGMGIVYKVEHSYLNKLFALKVMRPTKDEVDRMVKDASAHEAEDKQRRDPKWIAPVATWLVSDPPTGWSFLALALAAEGLAVGVLAALQPGESGSSLAFFRGRLGSAYQSLIE